MANEQRGEVELVAGTTSYTLCLSMNAICEMQTRTGKTYGELLRSMGLLDIMAVRDIVWMTLKKYHAKEFPSADTVGDLMDQVAGGPTGAVRCLNKLFTLNAEQAKNGHGETGNPQTAQS